jgi:hypothetical protein
VAYIHLRKESFWGDRVSIVTKRTTKKFICVDKKYGKEVEGNYRNRSKEKRWEEER